jgi:putative Holliday junction resolvase
MRLLGVDLGKKRIGVAVMDSDVGLPRALAALSAVGSLSGDADQVVGLAKKESCEGVVLGLPLDGGEETRMSGVMRRFGAEVESRGLAVHFVDESLTSAQAQSVMAVAGMKASDRKRRLDSESACLILERFLEAR